MLAAVQRYELESVNKLLLSSSCVSPRRSSFVHFRVFEDGIGMTELWARNNAMLGRLKSDVKNCKRSRIQNICTKSILPNLYAPSLEVMNDANVLLIT